MAVRLMDAAQTPLPDAHPRRPTLRPVARVLLIDDRDRALLIRVALPQKPRLRLWITPGGGIDEGETHEQAARRELREETGLAGVDLGPCVWWRRHIWQWGGEWIESVERFYLLRVPAFAAAPAAPDEWEREYMRECRWWSIEQIKACADTDTFAPRRLPELLPPILAGDIPNPPIDVGA